MPASSYIKNLKGPPCMLAAAILWSFGGLFIGFIPWGALSINGMRSLLAAAVFIIYRRSVKVRLTNGNVAAALCLCLTSTLIVFAYQLTTAAAAILLHFTSPVFIILLQFVFYGKKPRPSEAVAVMITILGMVLFFADSLETGNILGNILAICSGFAAAGMFLCNKRQDTIPEESLLLGFFICAAIGMPSVFLNVTADPFAWGSIIFLGIIQIGLAYLFFSIGIKKTSALLACIITALEPVLNPLWVALVTGEVPGPYAIAGGVIIIMTVAGFNVWTERKTNIL